MDPVTHVLSGALVGKAVEGRFPAGSLIVPFCALAAAAPDIDNFSSFLGPDAYLRLHRGLPHSFVGAAALALLLALGLKFLRRDVPFGRLAVVTYGCLLLHIFLDVITAYGTQIFLPFSDYRLSLPAVFIIDPVFTASLAVFLLLARMLKERAAFFALFGLAWAILYPMGCLGLRDAVTTAYAQKLKADGVVYTRLHVQPDALTPVFWKIIIEDGNSWRLGCVNLLAPKRQYPMERFDKADREKLREFGGKVPLFGTWEWFAVFPAVETSRGDTGVRLIYSDLRFRSVNPVLTTIFDRRETPFDLTAVLNGDGELTGYSYRHKKTSLAYAGQP